MQTFTVYRASTEFMNTLSTSLGNLKLHRERSYDFGGNERMLEANQEMLNQGFLIPVAKVECSKQNLFQLTNNITHAWSDNEEVTQISDEGFMSSISIGDIFKDENGKVYMVTMFDITEVELTLPEEVEA